VLLLWCSCGHNPLPTRVASPGSHESTRGHESRSVRPTRPGSLPDDTTLRPTRDTRATDTLADMASG
jgi:hypothetical protein